MDEENVRREMASLASKLYSQGFFSSQMGNLSVRLPRQRLLITPGGASAYPLKAEQIELVDFHGKVLVGQAGAPAELPLHLEIYRRREDVGAVIHAHPFTCIALTLVGIGLDESLIPEAFQALGRVPTMPYAPPSSEEARQGLAALIADHDAILLAHHGTLTAGRDLPEAWARLELLEHAARTVALARLLSRPGSLPPQVAEKLGQALSASR